MEGGEIEGKKGRKGTKSLNLFLVSQGTDGTLGIKVRNSHATKIRSDGRGGNGERC